ncbi:Gfo/Idh/MocA family protein [Mesorhizobium sp. NPDC059025]|uniref:Gfo/Idh/MocA family protein n=1 Tax=unclassified Mesorhizobium TaxID=325217 RepID=UPI0036A5C279
MTDPVRLGVLGLHNHYHAFPMADYITRGIDGVELVSVYDPRQAYAADYARQFGIGAVAGSRAELLADSSLDGVLVMSYTAAHRDDVLACAAAGKHVLLDKPIAMTVAEADAMVKAADKAGVVFMLAYHVRYLPAYQKVREMIANGVIGRPLTMKMSIRCPLQYVTDTPTSKTPGWYVDPKLAGGGGFLDHAVHYTDAMRYLLGSEGRTVYGKIARLTDHKIDLDDYGVCVITTDKSEIVTIESTWHAADWYSPMASPEECLIVGTLGEIHVHHQKSPQLEVSGRGIAGRQYFDWKGDDRQMISYRNLVIEFARAIRARVRPGVDGRDGLKALAIIEAAHASSALRREVSIMETGV